MMNDFIRNLEKVLEDAGPAADAISFWGVFLAACRSARGEGLLDKRTAQDYERMILEKLDQLTGGENTRQGGVTVDAAAKVTRASPTM